MFWCWCHGLCDYIMVQTNDVAIALYETPYVTAHERAHTDAAASHPTNLPNVFSNKSSSKFAAGSSHSTNLLLDLRGLKSVVGVIRGVA